MARKPKPSEPQGNDQTVANGSAPVTPEDTRAVAPKRTEHEGGIVSLDY